MDARRSRGRRPELPAAGAAGPGAVSLDSTHELKEDAVGEEAGPARHPVEVAGTGGRPALGRPARRRPRRDARPGDVAHTEGGVSGHRPVADEGRVRTRAVRTGMVGDAGLVVRLGAGIPLHDRQGDRPGEAGEVGLVHDVLHADAIADREAVPGARRGRAAAGLELGERRLDVAPRRGDVRGEAREAQAVLVVLVEHQDLPAAERALVVEEPARRDRRRERAVLLARPAARRHRLGGDVGVGEIDERAPEDDGHGVAAGRLAAVANPHRVDEAKVRGAAAGDLHEAAGLVPAPVAEVRGGIDLDPLAGVGDVELRHLLRRGLARVEAGLGPVEPGRRREGRRVGAVLQPAVDGVQVPEVHGQREDGPDRGEREHEEDEDGPRLRSSSPGRGRRHDHSFGGTEGATRAGAPAPARCGAT